MFIENVLKVKNEGWRYFIGCIIIFIITQIGSIPFTVAIFSKIGTAGAPNLDFKNLMTVLENSNLTLFYVLIPYVFGFFGILLVTKSLHNQTFISLTTSRNKINFSKIVTSFLVAGSIIIFSVAIGFFISPDQYLYNFNFENFLILFLISFLMIPLQTSFEEYLFRGYLMQGLGGVFRNRWIPLIITSFLFGLLHFWNPEVSTLGTIFLFHYILTGFFLGVLTIMDDGMELALGFHAGNNILISLLITADWTVLQTDSILKFIGDPKMSLSTILPIIVLYPLILIYFSKKYNWENWEKKILVKFEDKSNKILEK